MILFVILGVLAIVFAITTVLEKNPVKAAVYLVIHFFVLAGIYLTLNAQFIAAAQIMVYAGAIMVLIVFVIMLLNLRAEEKNKTNKNLKFVIAVFLPLGVLFLLLAVAINSGTIDTFMPTQTIESGSPKDLGLILYGDYMVNVIAIGMLLTAAIVGAVYLAKEKTKKLSS